MVKKKNDPLKQFVALAKKIGFPRTDGTLDYTKPTKWSEGSDHLEWSKHSGHAGRGMIVRCVTKALKAGFVKQREQDSLSPDGNYANHGSRYVKTVRGIIVAVLCTHSHYGVTQYENFFSMFLIGREEHARRERWDRTQFNMVPSKGV
jgi:hypothetical protein